LDRDKAKASPMGIERRRSPARVMRWTEPQNTAAPGGWGEGAAGESIRAGILRRPGPESQRSRSRSNTTTIISVRTIPHLLPRRVPPRGMVTERQKPRRKPRPKILVSPRLRVRRGRPRRQLYARREPQESPQTADVHQGRGSEPQSATGGAQRGARRPWWRRMFRS
jgi:hypothetical protein